MQSTNFRTDKCSLACYLSKSMAHSKESSCQCRRRRFYSWVAKMPWRRKWQPTPVFLLGESQDRGAWQFTVLGIARVGQDLSTKPPIHTEVFWEVGLEGLVFAKWLCLVPGQLPRLRHKFLSFKGRIAKCFEDSGILIIIMPFTCCVTLGNLPLCTSVSLSQPNSYQWSII